MNNSEVLKDLKDQLDLLTQSESKALEDLVKFMKNN